MGPSESPTSPAGKQASRRKRIRCQPRARRCLLKGCERRFHPCQARQRYCSKGCREAAREWSRWKAQQRYRDTAAGKEKRNGQSQRYRERVKKRPQAEQEPLPEAARVISCAEFFRALLRPAWLLRTICAAAAKPFAALLFACLPASAEASSRTRTALA